MCQAITTGTSSMQDSMTILKKRGCPKGRKDGPHQTGAPKRGRSKKKVNNGGNMNQIV